MGQDETHLKEIREGLNWVYGKIVRLKKLHANSKRKSHINTICRSVSFHRTLQLQ